MIDAPRGISRMEQFERAAEAYIQRKPSRLGPILGDVLDVLEVAAMLRCSVDTVRRIPDASLPSRVGPGKCVLYLRTDVILYVESLPEYGGFKGASSGETKPRRKTASASEGQNDFSLVEALARVVQLKKPS